MPIKILIVDDESANIELLDALLEPEGYSLIKAKSGEAALEYLSENDPDLVLLDIMMPGISGLVVLKGIRQSEKNRTIPVILLTSLADREDRLKGLGAGADDYISKPFDKAELVFKVKTQTGLSVLRRQINEKEKLAGVMDLVNEGAVLTDCAFNIQQMNRTALDMFGMKTQLGNLEDILLKKYGCIVERNTKSGKFLVVRPGTASGAPMYISAEFHKVGQSSGGVCTYVFVFKDVTGDYARNKMKMDFLTLISNKLRTPLAVISGYSAMLSIFETNEKFSEIIQSIMRNSEVMENLIKRVMFFVDIENISLTGTFNMFDTAATVDRLSLVYKKICVLLSPAGAVNVRYWQALAAEELIGNAIKFNNNKNPEIAVRFEHDGLTVEDNGPGIPPEEFEKVFEPFYQVDSKISGSNTGAGIGLSIVRSLAENAGVDVTIERGSKGGLRVVMGGKIPV